MEIDLASYMKFLFTLLFVLGLIGGAALLAKRAGLGNRGPVVTGRGKRLTFVETRGLDPTRRVILIKRDNKEHLLLLGNTNEQVIESGLDAPEIAVTETSAGKPQGEPFKIVNPFKAAS
ncbi:MAG: flagellar biosynthetic protein FliO [Rhodospirillaceae bacterium]